MFSEIIGIHYQNHMETINKLQGKMRCFLFVQEEVSLPLGWTNVVIIYRGLQTRLGI